MKKICFLLLIINLSLCLTISCNPDTSSNTPSSNTPQTPNGDIKDLVGVWFDVTDSTNISLNNIPDDILYSIQVTNTSKGFDLSAKGNNKKIAKTEDGSIIPIVDENGNCNFTGSDLGITSDGGKLKINQIKSNTTGDRMILSTENPSQRCEKKNDRYEEFYEAFFHVNLNSNKYKSLDREKIAIICKSTNGGGSASMSIDYGIFYTNNYHLNNASEFDRLLDLSSSPKFNVYMGIGINKSNPEVWRNFEIFITNPIELEYNVSKPIPSDVNVFRVAKDENKDNKYVIELTAPGTNHIYQGYEAFSDYANARYLDGTRVPYFAQMTNEESNVATYYLGSIDEDFLFNVCWKGNDSAQGYGSIKLRLITPEEQSNIVFIDSSVDKDYDFNIAKESNFKLFIVNPEINIASIEFKNMTEADSMVYYTLHHTSGPSYSNSHADTDDGVINANNNYCFEYFYIRSFDEVIPDISGTVSVTTSK